jgi:hypothetical protein
MANQRIPSRLQKIEDKKNSRQAVLFGFLSVGFLLLLIFVGMPLFVKAVIFLGEVRSGPSGSDRNDTIPPMQPRIVSSIEATRSANLKLEGFAEPGSTVSLFRNADKQEEIVADIDGVFLFSNIKLVTGQNLFYAVATDSSGNESQPSTEISIVYDNVPPDLINYLSQ